LSGHAADPAVQGRHLGLEGFTVRSVLVSRGHSEPRRALGDELPHRFLTQHLGLHTVEEELV